MVEPKAENCSRKKRVFHSVFIVFLPKSHWLQVNSDRVVPSFMVQFSWTIGEKEDDKAYRDPQRTEPE
jgi:hypothetical protein